MPLPYDRWLAQACSVMAPTSCPVTRATAPSPAAPACSKKFPAPPIQENSELHSETTAHRVSWPLTVVNPVIATFAIILAVKLAALAIFGPTSQPDTSNYVAYADEI